VDLSSYRVLDIHASDSIQIERRWEEGPQEVHCEEGMHDKLGLKEDEKEMSKI
jgi:hypothetical protein